MQEDDFKIKVEVVFNDFLIHGAPFYNYKKGRKFTLNKSDFDYHGFKELDTKSIEKINKKLFELDKFRKYLEDLLNEQ